ncbi:MAG: bifunctional DNA primase/polymerase [Cyanobacteria bacterium P01_G01_bin.38]
MNQQIKETLDWLKSQGLPSLPIAPVQDAKQYPARNRDGSLKRDKDGVLTPAFTGKNPSYLDVNGIPHLVRHTQYQNRMPTKQELQTWFANPANGIGTLGGWHDVVWIDIDVKQFESKEACDRKITQWLTQYPLLQQTFAERTHSGGWRFAVRVPEKTFTNFSLDGPGGKHVGEALGQGRVTVLAPTIGPSGKPYINLRRAPPVWVERLEAIGLYPVSRRRARSQPNYPRRPVQSLPAQPGVLRLEDLAATKAQAVLHGDSPFESRSHSLAFALREFYGWENWAAQNRVPISGNAKELAREAGAALGIDCDRIERIIQSISDPGSCLPATVFTGGEISTWKRVKRTAPQTYHNLCPDSIKSKTKTLVRQNERQVSHNTAASESLFSHTNPHPLLAIERSEPIPITSNEKFQRFIQCALYILVRTCHSTAATKGQSNNHPRHFVQGQTYRVESAGKQLIVKAKGRGTILRSQGSQVISTQLTIADLERFQAEVWRIRQCVTTTNLMKTNLSYEQIFESER